MKKLPQRFLDDMKELLMDEYDDFIAQLKQMNVDRAVEIVQTVYDRFQAR